MNGKPVFTVPMKTVINFDSGFGKKLLCDGPTFTAGQACAYSCSFCYVESMQKNMQAYFKKHGVTGEHADVVIRNQDVVKRAREQLLAHPEAERQKRKVIYSSPKVDVAANLELVAETVEICKVIFELTNWDIRLLSKSTMLPKIAQALDEHPGPFPVWARHNPQSRVIYGVSTGTLNDKLAQSFEEGCPLVSKRIESLRWLQDNGFRTFGMICPSLPMADYALFADEMLRAIRFERCEHVWAEVINVRGESFTKTVKALRDGGFENEARNVERVSNDPAAWEDYARETFMAEAEHFGWGPGKPSKLRFLQYVTKSNRHFWEMNQQRGAVLL